MQGGFIWDDDTILTENKLIKANDGLYRLWCTTEPLDYFPLTYTALWLEWRLWGMNALGYHVVNVLLHALSAVFIWLVLHRLKVPGACLASLIFAIHPVNVESVAWITERKNVLPMVFYMLSILLFLKFESNERLWLYGLSLGSFLLALLSKTSVVMLPFILLSCAWWQRGRIVRKDLLRSVPFLSLSGILGLVTIWFQYKRVIISEIVRTDSFLSRLAGAAWAIWFYIYKAIIPYKLTFVYPRWQIDKSSIVSFLPVLLLVGLLILFLRYQRRWGRAFLFGVGYFIVTLFPVLGFFNIYFMKYSLVADHWQYTSIIGIIALLVGLGSYAYNSWWKAPRQLAIIVVFILIGLLSLQTWRQCHIYKDSETLWRDTISKNPDAYLAHLNLGVLLAHQGNFKEAMRHYSEALRIKPNNAKAHINLGVALERQSKLEEAISHYSKALVIKPNYAEAHYNLGVALGRQGNFTEAMHHYSKALRLKPNHAEAHNNLGNALARQGRLEEAMSHFSEALKIKPEYAEAHYNLGVALVRQGNFKDAINHFSEALKIKPDFKEANYNLELSLKLIGKNSTKP